jgi:hypothetical protein
MQIRFERTGGLVGRRIQGSIDSSSLSKPQARLLLELLDQSHFFDLPLKLESAAPGADRFTYRVTVETESGSHTVEANDAAVPVELRPLLNWLTRSLSLK